MLRRILVFSFAVALLAGPALAADPTTPDATTPAARAESLFKAGKIAEARDAYAAAAKADPENAELERQHQILSRVLEMEAAVAAQDPSPSWERMVCTLHAFYLRSDLPAKALKLDREAHGRIDSAISASLVLEAMLELDDNAGALAFADDLREGQMTDGNRIYKGIAAARLGKKDLVREDMELFGTPEATDTGLRYDLARLQALMGDREAALASLKGAFESCPPRGVETLRTLAAASPDFASVKGDAFQTVLETPTKVSDCGSCGGCGSGCGDKSECGDCGGCDEKKDGGCCGSCPEGKECGGGACPAGEKQGGCSGGCPATGK